MIDRNMSEMFYLIRKYTDTSGQERRSTGCTISISIEEGAGEKGEGNTDEMIAALALKRKAAVLTNDEELRTKLSQAGIATVYLRGKNRLVEGE